MSESHFDNDLIVETKLAEILERYQEYNKTDVFGQTFKRYSKNNYDRALVSIRYCLVTFY